MDHVSSRIPHALGTLPFVDGAFGQQIVALRREIEGIQELNTIYRSKGKHHGYRDRADNQRGMIRLQEIMQQLGELLPKNPAA
jgi:hypothetical protein